MVAEQTRVEAYLQSLDVPFRVLGHAPGAVRTEAASTHGVSLKQVLTAGLLSCQGHAYMVIRSAEQFVEPAGLTALLNGSVEVMDERRLAALTAGFDLQALPALPGLFKVRTVIDLSVREYDSLAIQSENPGIWLLVQRADAERILWPGADWGHFSRTPVNLLRSELDEQGELDAQRLERLRDRVGRLRSLPAMPDLARRVLELRVNPFADAEDLARIVQLDPSLSAQIMSIASSAYYGYRGKISSIRDAITRVLGYEMVLNLALGICIGKRFAMPAEGPLGARAHWRHAVTAAVLAELLAKCLHPRFQVRPGLAYLAGLLHDFGHMVLYQVFNRGYQSLQEAAALNADLPITAVESEVLGVRHDQIGAWLMRAWGLPEELQVSVRWHHVPEYSGEHAIYAQLAGLADRLHPLIRSTTPAAAQSLIQSQLVKLEFDRERLMAAISKLQESAEGLDSLADQLVA